MEYKWKVKKSERGMSLENFIYKQLGNWSHKQVKTAIDNKRTFINGRNVFISKWNVKPNDVVLFAPSPKDLPGGVSPSGRHKFIDVLFEDSYIIAVNKPPFVDHESFMHSVIDYLQRRNQGQGHPYLGAMHRLDKETTGVMIYTKKKIANKLAEQFREHRIRKRYVALVQGRVDQDRGKIDKAIEKGHFEEGKKARIGESKEARRAVSYYEVKERYDDASLVSVEIVTGRTHQIRVHMAHLGYPLIGDKLYLDELLNQDLPPAKEKSKDKTKTLDAKKTKSDKPDLKKSVALKTKEEKKAPFKVIPFKRHALHAEILECWHPVTNQKLKIMAKLPDDMAKLIDRLRMGE